jgi:hypothetical protein
LTVFLGRYKTPLPVTVPSQEEVFHLQVERFDNIRGPAPAEAVEKNPPVLTFRDGEAWIAVLVRRTQGLVAFAPLLHALQPVEYEIYGLHSASSLEPPCGMISTYIPYRMCSTRLPGKASCQRWSSSQDLREKILNKTTSVSGGLWCRLEESRIML